MTPAFARLIALVDDYLAHDDYMTLWSPIAGPGAADQEPGPFSPDEKALWDQLYDLVYMGQQDSASPGEARDGLIRGPELRARLQEWRATALAAVGLTSA